MRPLVAASDQGLTHGLHPFDDCNAKDDDLRVRRLLGELAAEFWWLVNFW
jgi:hypothetical protein